MVLYALLRENSPVYNEDFRGLWSFRMCDNQMRSYCGNTPYEQKRGETVERSGLRLTSKIGYFRWI